MGLVQRIQALTTRLGYEVKRKIGADHPGLARAWVCFGAEGGHVTVCSAYNVAVVTRFQKGRYRVHFSSPMPDANYCWMALARSSVDTGQQRIAVVRVSGDDKTAHFVDVSCASAATSFADSREVNLVVYR